MSHKKKILLTAGGTATTWHFCQVIKSYFKEDFEIYITDTNESYLTPSSIYAHKFFQVPPVKSPDYIKTMHQLIQDEKIDIIVPLIDFDLFNFAKDDEFLKKLNIVTTAPLLSTSKTLTEKKAMFEFLSTHHIPTPRLYAVSEIKNDQKYVVKPELGFGSQGVAVLLGEEIRSQYFDPEDRENLEKPESHKGCNKNKNIIIQEFCDSEEITAEVYNGETLEIFQRRRVATKEGVCVKMIPVYYPEIDTSIKKLTSVIECPTAFCVQFRQNEAGEWCLFDCNLRIGAGTALSSKIGFQLTRALLTHLLGQKIDASLFQIDRSIKSVLRVYEEIAIK